MPFRYGLKTFDDGSNTFPSLSKTVSKCVVAGHRLKARLLKDVQQPIDFASGTTYPKRFRAFNRIQESLKMPRGGLHTCALRFKMPLQDVVEGHGLHNSFVKDV